MKHKTKQNRIRENNKDKILKQTGRYYKAETETETDTRKDRSVRFLHFRIHVFIVVVVFQTLPVGNPSGTGWGGGK